VIVASALQIWSLTFCKEFDKLPGHIQEAIRNKIDEMGTRLASFQHHRLTGRTESRMRIGDYRVLYDYDIALGRIYLLYIGHRREIYK